MLLRHHVLILEPEFKEVSDKIEDVSLLFNLIKKRDELFFFELLLVFLFRSQVSIR
jgi:hypothetical protein